MFRFSCIFLIFFTPTHAKTNEMYGEITHQCVLDIVQKFSLVKQDTVVDLGSGNGNACFYFSPFVEKCIGYEIVHERYQKSIENNNTTNTEFYWKDFTTLDTIEASVLFTHSTMFDKHLLQNASDLIHRSPTIRIVFSQKALPNMGNRERFNCKFSWSGHVNTEIYVYRPHEEL